MNIIEKIIGALVLVFIVVAYFCVTYWLMALLSLGVAFLAKFIFGAYITLKTVTLAAYIFIVLAIIRIIK